jgi:hypothetical protein
MGEAGDEVWVRFMFCSTLLSFLMKTLGLVPRDLSNINDGNEDRYDDHDMDRTMNANVDQRNLRPST